MVQYVLAVCQFHRNFEVLFDQDDPCSLAMNFVKDLNQLIDDDGRKSFSGFVEQQHSWIAQQGSSNGEHLLFATRELIASEMEPFLQPGKYLKHSTDGPVSGVVGNGADL